MSETWTVEHLLKGVGKNLDLFAVKAIIPDDDNPHLYFCQIRTRTLQKTYETQELMMGIGVSHDLERKLLGLYMRVITTVPAEAYGWALDFLNGEQQEELHLFSQLSLDILRPDDDEEDGEPADDDSSADEAEELRDLLILESGYHLSTNLQVLDQRQYVKLLTLQMRDAMQRIFTEAFEVAELMSDRYAYYCRHSRN